ncbi:hypothetical protein HK105_202802 [Polyrhizophydium stewartii]|uniref:Ubiquitin carboxyl-terminal hydrolase n=1 Tax=Polyrhizophydium stewartii TaxID=2732419 RepID=A0ABR4NDJ3_9FUNG
MTRGAPTNPAQKQNEQHSLSPLLSLARSTTFGSLGPLETAETFGLSELQPFLLPWTPPEREIRAPKLIFGSIVSSLAVGEHSEAVVLPVNGNPLLPQAQPALSTVRRQSQPHAHSAHADHIVIDIAESTDLAAGSTVTAADGAHGEAPHPLHLANGSAGPDPTFSAAASVSEPILAGDTASQSSQRPASRADRSVSPSKRPPSATPRADRADDGAAAASAPRPATPSKPSLWSSLLKGASPKPGSPVAVSVSMDSTGSLSSQSPRRTGQQSQGSLAQLGSSQSQILRPSIAEAAKQDLLALLRSTPSNTPKLIRPRGLINNGNMCFMNAILQPLLHCPPLYNFYRSYSKTTHHSFKSKTPLTDAMLLFLNEFEEEEPNQAPSKQGKQPFVPEYVYDALRRLKRVNSIKGRQEDAQEFLGFLIDELHEELLGVIRSLEAPGSDGSGSNLRANGHASHAISGNGVDSASDEALGGNSSGADSVANAADNTWFEVGKKNRTLVTRNTDIDASPVSNLFGGRMRSVVRSPGSKDSITLEPFMSLQLDITPAHIKTIHDALLNLAAPETIEGFLSSTSLSVATSSVVPSDQAPQQQQQPLPATHTQTITHTRVVDAIRQSLIDSAPPVLTLHLKRFVYDAVKGTTLKIRKYLPFPPVLHLAPEVLSPAAIKSGLRHAEYRLFAIVHHHGELAAGGHYTCDVLRQDDTWLHIDDDEITQTTLAEVTREHRNRQPYVLFYRRA